MSDYARSALLALTPFRHQRSRSKVQERSSFRDVPNPKTRPDPSSFSTPCKPPSNCVTFQNPLSSQDPNQRHTLPVMSQLTMSQISHDSYSQPSRQYSGIRNGTDLEIHPNRIESSRTNCPGFNSRSAFRPTTRADHNHSGTTPRGINLPIVKKEYDSAMPAISQDSSVTSSRFHPILNIPSSQKRKRSWMSMCVDMIRTPSRKSNPQPSSVNKKMKEEPVDVTTTNEDPFESRSISPDVDMNKEYFSVSSQATDHRHDNLLDKIKKYENLFESLKNDIVTQGEKVMNERKTGLESTLSTIRLEQSKVQLDMKNQAIDLMTQAENTHRETLKTDYSNWKTQALADIQNAEARAVDRVSKQADKMIQHQQLQHNSYMARIEKVLKEREEDITKMSNDVQTSLIDAGNHLKTSLKTSLVNESKDTLKSWIDEVKRNLDISLSQYRVSSTYSSCTNQGDTTQQSNNRNRDIATSDKIIEKNDSSSTTAIVVKEYNRRKTNHQARRELSKKKYVVISPTPKASRVTTRAMAKTTQSTTGSHNSLVLHSTPDMSIVNKSNQSSRAREVRKLNESVIDKPDRPSRNKKTENYDSLVSFTNRNESSIDETDRPSRNKETEKYDSLVSLTNPNESIIDEPHRPSRNKKTSESDSLVIFTNPNESIMDEPDRSTRDKKPGEFDSLVQYTSPNESITKKRDKPSKSKESRGFDSLVSHTKPNGSISDKRGKPSRGGKSGGFDSLTPHTNPSDSVNDKPEYKTPSLDSTFTVEPKLTPTLSPSRKVSNCDDIPEKSFKTPFESLKTKHSKSILEDSGTEKSTSAFKTPPFPTSYRQKDMNESNFEGSDEVRKLPVQDIHSYRTKKVRLRKKYGMRNFGLPENVFVPIRSTRTDESDKENDENDDSKRETFPAHLRFPDLADNRNRTNQNKPFRLPYRVSGGDLTDPFAFN